MTTTRREFVSGSLVTLAGASVSACAGAKKVSATPGEDGNVSVALADHPELKNPGGFIGLDVEGGEPVMVFHGADGEMRAVGRKCPHLGCKVKYDGEDDEVVCPCHGSRFDLEGGLVKGPAKEGLPKYAVVREGDTLVVSVRG